MSLRVLLSAPYMIYVLDRIKPIFESHSIELVVPEVEERLSEGELLQIVGEIDGVVCGDDEFTARVLKAAAPKLKIISKWGTGIDSIDKDTADKLGIKVRNTPGAFTDPVADSVMGYVLSFARMLPWMDQNMKRGGWNKIRGRALSECVIGVVGVGRIGKAVLRRAKSFGMLLLGNDIVPISPDFLKEVGVRMLELSELLPQVDFLSLNCDLNPTSYHLLGRGELSLMRPEAVVINTSRGSVIDEEALVDALEHGQIAGAGLDVFEHEPLEMDSPLRKMDNVLLAPHNANSSPSSWERVHRNTLCNLFDGLGLPTSQMFDDI
ncbi:MAG: dihydrofolate reductase [Anaerolineales bacterium]|nr:dihydrofolate reductase [Anaerolineales bacterium]